jgi:recombination protein RecR
MGLYIRPIEKLIQELSRLPGIGEKTASRLAFFLINSSKDYVEELAASIVTAKEEVGFCTSCYNLSDEDPCKICDNGNRSHDCICVVEKPKDLIAFERSGTFKGKYHVLHGALSPLHGIGPDNLKIKELMERLEKDKEVKEVIIATNPNMEGEATALYVTKLLKPFNVMVTRIAFGVPMGGEIEYIDGETLGKSLSGRHEY